MTDSIRSFGKQTIFGLIRSLLCRPELTVCYDCHLTVTLSCGRGVWAVGRP